MTTVDASLPKLIDPGNTGRAWSLLTRASRTYAGKYALLKASGALYDVMFSAGVGSDKIGTTAVVGQSVWRDGVIRLSVRIPDTVAVLMDGRPATDLVDHPALAGRTMAAITQREDGASNIVLDTLQVPLERLPGARGLRAMLTGACITFDMCVDACTWMRLWTRRREPLGNMRINRFNRRLAANAAAGTAGWGLTAALVTNMLVTDQSMFGMSMTTLLLVTVPTAVVAYVSRHPFKPFDDLMIMPPWRTPRRDE